MFTQISIAHMQTTQTYSGPHFKIICLLLTLIFSGTLLISGCGNPDNQISKIAVPYGDKQALDQLANAYRSQTSKLATTPNGLRPKAKRRFIELIFQIAGYNYSLTLLQVSQQNIDFNIQLNKDLAELLLLPQMGIKQEDLSSFNSEAEIKAINILFSHLK